MRHFASFVHDRKAASAVEFAIVVVPLIYIMLFLFQMSVYMYWTEALGNTAQRAARAIRTGVIHEARMSSDEFKEREICPRLRGGVSCDEIIVAVNSVAKQWTTSRTEGGYRYIDKSRVDLLKPNLDQSNASYCPGGPGDLVYLDLLYKAPVLAIPFGRESRQLDVNGRPIVLLRSTSVVMNEPFEHEPLKCS